MGGFETPSRFTVHAKQAVCDHQLALVSGRLLQQLSQMGHVIVAVDMQARPRALRQPGAIDNGGVVELV